jgi:hypothetical protein
MRAALLARTSCSIALLAAGRPEHVKRVVTAAAESERHGSPLKSFLPVIPIDSV